MVDMKLSDPLVGGGHGIDLGSASSIPGLTSLQSRLLTWEEKGYPARMTGEGWFMQVRPRGAGGEVLGPFQPFQSLGERTFSITLASLSIYYSHFTDEKRKAVGTHTQAPGLPVLTAVLYGLGNELADVIVQPDMQMGVSHWLLLSADVSSFL